MISWFCFVTPNNIDILEYIAIIVVMMLILLEVVIFVTSDVDVTGYIVIDILINCKSILKSYILPYIPGYIVGQVNDLLLHGVQAEHLHRIVQVLPSLMMMKKIMMMIMRG